MTAEVSGAGSVEAAAAAVLAAHQTGTVVMPYTDAITAVCSCGWRGSDGDIHQAAQLAAAGLLAAPVPAADTDEALRQRLTRIFDLEDAGDDPWRLDLMCAALSAHQAREVAAAEERGRRAGLLRAAEECWGNGPITRDDVRGWLRREAGRAAPTTTDEEGPT